VPCSIARFWQPASDLPRTDSELVAKSRLGELDGTVFDTVSGQWVTAADGRT